MHDVQALSLELRRADCLLVVPPLAHLTWPSLGVHVLQACAREAGFDVAILYMNALYGALIGPLNYANLANAPTAWLLGERLFARAAFGAPPLGFQTERFLAQVDVHNANADDAATLYLDTLSAVSGEFYEEGDTHFPPDDLVRFEQIAFALADRVAEAIAEVGYPVVGSTSTFDQTAASLAVLAGVKARRPETRTIVGGANCEDEMALGIRSLSDVVDHVFAGESEQVFVEFLEAWRDGRDPGPPIIRGAPCRDMDALPTPSFTEFFDQTAALPQLEGAPIWICYETSRGCWWGQKHHCTFCGLNGLGMEFRGKSADRVIEELNTIFAESPTRKVCMTDNIMPWRYHKTLVPRLPEEVGEMHVYYEQKANLTLDQVKNLWDAGSRTIQPGIEAMDDALLQLMRKGVPARQNVALLRYARSLGMGLRWNLLWGFPNDDIAMYERTLELIRLLHHLLPPSGMQQVAIGRFSPYFDHAESFGVVGLRPADSYGEVFPAHASVRHLAYHHEAAFHSASHAAPELMAELDAEVRKWRGAWAGDPQARPVLWVQRVAAGQYVLMDTRGLGGPPTVYLNEVQARAVLVGGKRSKVRGATWAIRSAYAADVGGWCVPLAVGSYALLREFEDRFRGASAETLQMPQLVRATGI